MNLGFTPFGNRREIASQGSTEMWKGQVVIAISSVDKGYVMNISAKVECDRGWRGGSIQGLEGDEECMSRGGNERASQETRIPG
jgi:hypothetical protein